MSDGLFREKELAKVLGVTRELLRNAREGLTEGVHWLLAHGAIVYSEPGVRRLLGAIGMEVVDDMVGGIDFKSILERTLQITAEEVRKDSAPGPKTLLYNTSSKKEAAVPENFQDIHPALTPFCACGGTGIYKGSRMGAGVPCLRCNPPKPPEPPPPPRPLIEKAMLVVDNVPNRNKMMVPAIWKDGDDVLKVRVRVRNNKNFVRGMEIPCRQIQGEVWELIGRCPRFRGKW